MTAPLLFAVPVWVVGNFFSRASKDGFSKSELGLSVASTGPNPGSETFGEIFRNIIAGFYDTIRAVDQLRITKAPTPTISYLAIPHGALSVHLMEENVNMGKPRLMFLVNKAVPKRRAFGGLTNTLYPKRYLAT